MNKEARCFVGTRCLSDLLLHPSEHGIGRDVDMNNAPRVDLHDDEDVGGLRAADGGPRFPGPGLPAASARPARERVEQIIVYAS